MKIEKIKKKKKGFKHCRIAVLLFVVRRFSTSDNETRKTSAAPDKSSYRDRLTTTYVDNFYHTAPQSKNWKIKKQPNSF